LAITPSCSPASTAPTLGCSTLRNLSLEFGPGEALDSLVVRPAAMYFATSLTSDLAIAVILGKLAADIAFYIPAIAAYELRLRLSRARDGTR
jgi:hypothetical protein